MYLEEGSFLKEVNSGSLKEPTVLNSRSEKVTYWLLVIDQQKVATVAFSLLIMKCNLPETQIYKHSYTIKMQMP